MSPFSRSSCPLVPGGIFSRQSRGCTPVTREVTNHHLLHSGNQSPRNVAVISSWDIGHWGSLAGSNILLCQHKLSRLMFKGLSPENKEVSPYIPLQAGYRSKKQSSTYIWKVFMYAFEFYKYFLTCCFYFYLKSFYFIFISILLNWRYIVILAKVLTIYLNLFPQLFPLSLLPSSQNSFHRSHFSIFIPEYRIFPPYSSSSPFPYVLPLSLEYWKKNKQTFYCSFAGHLGDPSTCAGRVLEREGWWMSQIASDIVGLHLCVCCGNTE
jgi:hypothetical protein